MIWLAIALAFGGGVLFGFLVLAMFAASTAADREQRAYLEGLAEGRTEWSI